MVPPCALGIAMTRVNHRPPRIRRAAPPLQNPNIQNSERLHGEGCRPHTRVRNLSRGGPGGHCWYPEDRTPPHISFKSKTKGKMGAHARVSRDSRPLAQGSSRAAACLMAVAPAARARGSSGTAMCPVDPAPVFGHRTTRMAPGLSCAP
jgi:hypothetical protein